MLHNLSNSEFNAGTFDASTPSFTLTRSCEQIQLREIKIYVATTIYV